MRFKIENSRKQISQLRKRLKRFPRQPLPEDVHRLRGLIRTLEAIAEALNSGRERKVRRRLKALIVISKAAGKVRDMDVLVELACSLPTRRKDECLVQLLEYLGEQRFKAAAKLHETISAKREEAFHSLKQCSQLLDGSLSQSKKNTPASLPTHMVGLVQALALELSDCPRLNKDSLHSFRLKVKELRSILLLLEGSDTTYIAALGKAKDEIGAWHDWNVLAAISHRLAGRNPACELQKLVQRITTKKLKRAIAVANQLRKKSRALVILPELDRPGKTGRERLA
jgi:CHAD domain-containing protein